MSNRITVEYCKAKMGFKYARVKAGNGKILVTTEMYLRKAGARNAMRALKSGFNGEVKERELW